jgi:hypothetical protein
MKVILLYRYDAAQIHKLFFMAFPTRIGRLNNTGKHDFFTRNVECDSYVTFYAEFKNVIRIFLSPIGFV